MEISHPPIRARAPQLFCTHQGFQMSSLIGGMKRMRQDRVSRKILAKEAITSFLPPRLVPFISPNILQMIQFVCLARLKHGTRYSYSI